MQEDRIMSAATLHTIAPEDALYPANLKSCTAFKTTPTLYAIGNLSLLRSPTVALFCSTQCPEDLIPKIHDIAQSCCNTGTPIISGFHTPIEQDCLTILLGGTQPIIYCPARCLHNFRLSPTQHQAIQENRLLLLSPFSASYPRATAALAAKRNALIAAIADTLFIPYAAPDSKTLSFIQDLLKSDKSVVTFDYPGNSAQHESGITLLNINTSFLALP
jgi:predicted Rossmann fold nucleotide-binding protein DprA/Smf involved in DNA uptake